jgi:hypothetical protein
MARVAKPRALGSGRRSSLLTARCYTGVEVRPERWIGTLVMRSFPVRFDWYMAPSALMISSSGVRPSSG